MRILNCTLEQCKCVLCAKCSSAHFFAVSDAVAATALGTCPFTSRILASPSASVLATAVADAAAAAGGGGALSPLARPLSRTYLIKSLWDYNWARPQNINVHIDISIIIAITLYLFTPSR